MQQTAESQGSSTPSLQCPECLQEVTPSAYACPVCAADLSPLIVLRRVMDHLSPVSVSGERQAGEASKPQRWKARGYAGG